MCLAQGPQRSDADEALTRFHGLIIYIHDVASMNLQSFRENSVDPDQLASSDRDLH